MEVSTVGYGTSPMWKKSSMEVHFIYNIEKLPYILQTPCGVNTAVFLKDVWTYFSIRNETLNEMPIND